MKFPNHILLDFSTLISSNTHEHWILRNLVSSKSNYANRIGLYYLQKKFFTDKFFECFIESRAWGAKLSNLQDINEQRPHTFNFKLKIKNKNTKKILFSYKKFTLIYAKQAREKNEINFKKNLLWDSFDFYFLRKEKIYTKLKYSRVPQYDIVSGGVAALFAGFLGFLICEKFGFELLDSGDFYILFMYVTIFCFFCKLFLKLFSTQDQWSVLSLKWAYQFYKFLVSQIFTFLGRLLRLS